MKARHRWNLKPFITSILLVWSGNALISLNETRASCGDYVTIGSEKPHSNAVFMPSHDPHQPHSPTCSGDSCSRNNFSRTLAKVPIRIHPTQYGHLTLHTDLRANDSGKCFTMLDSIHPSNEISKIYRPPR